jgi:hypothetical protein
MANIISLCSRFHSWRVTFFMVWGGAFFTSGWIVRCISSYKPGNLYLYVAQTILILGGPPIYSAAEYNILGRLMNYLPMHAPLHPDRVVYFFIYLGAAVECLTAIGAARLSAAGEDKAKMQSGGNFIASAVVLQGVIELVFMGMVGLLHYRCVRSNMLTRKVQTVCIMLYGTSALVLFRCIFRAVETFSLFKVIASATCDGTCDAVIRHEWYLYAFEAAPMVLYTYWINIIHPGKFLPHQRNCYLSSDKTVRVGPGWIDRRSEWSTFVDPFDFSGILKGQPAHEKFWLRSDEWPIVVDGNEELRSVASGTTGVKHRGQNEPTAS